MSNAVQMTKAEHDLRYIYAKLPAATEVELGLLAAFIRGLGVIGWDDGEYYRKLPAKFRNNKE